MIDNIIKKVCREYQIEEKILFLKSNEDNILEPLYITTYIAHYKMGLSISLIHSLYKNKGFTKGRTTVYNHLKSMSNLLDSQIYIKEIYDKILFEFESEKDQKREGVKTRLLKKLNSIPYHKLPKLEIRVDTFIKAEC